MKTYSIDQLYEEMAFIAFHFHWPRDELMALEHGERRRWCEEISTINRRLNDDPEGSVSLFDVA
jgi:hypothetical protein